jgi:hypothetical protein
MRKGAIIPIPHLGSKSTDAKELFALISEKNIVSFRMRKPIIVMLADEFAAPQSSCLNPPLINQ